jgi:hypothetical protein
MVMMGMMALFDSLHSRFSVCRRFARTRTQPNQARFYRTTPVVMSSSAVVLVASGFCCQGSR